MATKSFDEMMVIDTPEKARNLEAAVWRAEAKKVLRIEKPSVLESFETEEEFFRNNPSWLEEFIAKTKERMRRERLELTEDEGPIE
ncbi:MAG: hypothetical protein LBH69_04345 [Methanomassiliicoccaceae archaeon]|jgi:hypothetical protein|nr:hypothetical protein [Methanomassiliicoccaceae archaeon]